MEGQAIMTWRETVLWVLFAITAIVVLGTVTRDILRNIPTFRQWLHSREAPGLPTQRTPHTQSNIINTTGARMVLWAALALACFTFCAAPTPVRRTLEVGVFLDGCSRESAQEMVETASGFFEDELGIRMVPVFYEEIPVDGISIYAQLVDFVRQASRRHQDFDIAVLVRPQLPFYYGAVINPGWRYIVLTSANPRDLAHETIHSFRMDAVHTGDGIMARASFLSTWSLGDDDREAINRYLHRDFRGMEPGEFKQNVAYLNGGASWQK